MRKFVIHLIQIYQFLFSPYLGGSCRFYPSCSQYAKDAILKKGILKGLWFSVKRISKCHPLHSGGFDPVS